MSLIKMNDNVSFSDMDGYRGSSGKFGLNFKQIILMHINRCVINGANEWHGGYWETRGYNPVTKTYVPNSREVYNNSVKMLRACLLGYFDEKMQKADDELQKEIKEAFDKCKESVEDGKKDFSEWNSLKTGWHIRLFEELLLLSKRLNFFEEEDSGEIV